MISFNRSFFLILLKFFSLFLVYILSLLHLCKIFKIQFPYDLLHKVEEIFRETPYVMLCIYVYILVRITVENTQFLCELRVGSIPFICQPIGSVISGTVLEPLGRKKSMLLVNIPHLLGWYLFYTAISLPVLFLAAILMGLGKVINLSLYQLATMIG